MEWHLLYVGACVELGIGSLGVGKKGPGGQVPLEEAACPRLAVQAAGACAGKRAEPGRAMPSRKHASAHLARWAAGAQVLVSALSQVLGAVAVEGCIRPPADVAVVEATVRLSPGRQVTLKQFGSVACVFPCHRNRHRRVWPFPRFLHQGSPASH